MTNPTELQMVAAFRDAFPLCSVSEHERAFLAFVHIARSHGVGYGWMRQAIGIAWKLADPFGYLDDERLVSLHATATDKAEAKR